MAGIAVGMLVGGCQPAGGTPAGSGGTTGTPPSVETVAPTARATTARATTAEHSVAPAAPPTTSPAEAAPTQAAEAPAPLVAPPAAEASNPPRHADPEAESGTDTRYKTCKEAKAHGLGPYSRDKDPEYVWYRDGDGDGVVCE